MMKRSSVLLLSIAAICIWAGNAHAAVLEVNEWSNTTRTGWEYNQLASGNPSIDNTTDTPAGGGALKSTHPAGTFSTSYGGGRGAYVALPAGLTELYVGHWVKWSSNWVWHPVGTKIDYQVMRDVADAAGHRDNYLVMVQNNGKTLTFTQQLWNAPGTQNRYNNRGSVNIQNNRWYWLETHIRLNTVGQANGFLEIWLDDVLVTQHSDVTYRTTNTTIGTWLHSPEFGGGGFTLPETQYVWFDHTVLSTTRIGRPGSTSSGDTTAPRSPVLNFAN